MIITREFIHDYKTGSGGWTKKQIEALGLKWPVRKGWQHSLIGKEISDKQVQEFIKGRDIRVNRLNTPKTLKTITPRTVDHYLNRLHSTHEGEI